MDWDDKPSRDEETDTQPSVMLSDKQSLVPPKGFVVPVRSVGVLLWWLIFRSESLRTYLRNIDPQLDLELAVWKVGPNTDVDPRFAFLRRSRWRLIVIVPLLVWASIGGLLTFAGGDFDWVLSRTYLFSFLGTTLLTSAFTMSDSAQNEHWLKRLFSWGINLALFSLFMSEFLPFLKPFTPEAILHRVLPKDLILPTILGVFLSSLSNRLSFSGAVLCTIGSVCIGVLGADALGPFLGLWFGVAFAIAIGPFLGTCADPLFIVIIVLVVLLLLGALVPWLISIIGSEVPDTFFSHLFIAGMLTFLITYFRLPLYIFVYMPRSLRLSYFAARRPTEACRFWRDQPVRWNEFVLPPLPGLKRHLQAFDETGEWLEAVADVGSAPLQQSSLPTIMRQCISDHAFACRSIWDIASFRQATASIPIGFLPTEEQQAITELHKISSDMAEVLALSGTEYSQRLGEIRARLTALSMSRDRHRMWPRISVDPIVYAQIREWYSTPKWRLDRDPSKRYSQLIRGPLIDLDPSPRMKVYREVQRHWIHSITEGLEQSVTKDVTGRLPNAEPLPEGSPFFQGTLRWFQELEHSIEASGPKSSLLILGQPHGGKSSWLNQLRLHLSERLIPIIVPLDQLGRQSSNDVELASLLVARCRSELQRAIRPISTQSIRSEIFVSVPNSYDLFADWLLTQVLTRMRSNERILIVLDGYDQFDTCMIDKGLSSDFLNTIRVLAVNQKIVLAFCGDLNFQACALRWQDTLQGVTAVKQVVLPLLNAEQIAAYAGYTFRSWGKLPPSQNAIGTMVEMTGGHPDLLRRLLLELRDIPGIDVDSSSADKRSVREQIISASQGLMSQHKDLLRHIARWAEAICGEPEITRDILVAYATGRQPNQEANPAIQAIILDTLIRRQVIMDTSKPCLRQGLLASWYSS